MNPMKKLFCRSLQAIFHLAQPILPYKDPEILNSIQDVPVLLNQQNISSVLLVTDPFLRSSGVTAPLEKLLDESGIRCAVYDRTQANPTVANVEEARQLYIEHRCQASIAFGGGSAMDCAKAVGARIARPDKRIDQLEGILRIMRKLPMLIAIPTTAGTGSEVTPAAVITDPETHHKFTVDDFPLMPTYAVLDPTITYTLPPSLTASTGMDALTHAVEAYVGRNTTKLTRSYALEATRLIFENIEIAYTNGNDRAARANMLLASNLAGKAFARAFVGYVHAVAHTLGGQYGIPHGVANSVLLPIVLEAYGEAAHKKLHELAVAAGISTPEDSHAEGAKKFIAAIRAMNKRMHIPEKLAGIRKEDIPKMARHADREGNPLYPVPVLMDAKELEQFYYKVADWSECHDEH